MAAYLGRAVPGGTTPSRQPCEAQIGGFTALHYSKPCPLCGDFNCNCLLERPGDSYTTTLNTTAPTGTVTNGAVTINMGSVVANGVKAYASLV